ncbi:SDR family oxidoreductase [Planosporangium thailandense]|uniref:SDR family oxidoreductase n=2 Tax=Planosporangium thailandense TaxID=765197 RepID=A0ABX0Y4Z0_9ACTN|nr:SDR family oxidoreductase [Planosporangium thailandense]NJC73098.1 SDR family oxidoreductase [Planosporangium thailandense]
MVTGGCGYLGRVLTRLLADEGYEVVALDNGLVPVVGVAPDAMRVTGDVRNPAEWEHLLADVDSVVHLAAIVGDPACAVDPELAWEVNYLGTIRVAQACRRYGVRTLVFASTCSNYGMTDDAEVDEGSPLNPRSEYARSKVMAEHHLLSLPAGTCSTTILRFATLHGLSPRMRFDLAINRMTADAVQRRAITVHDGRQWRPFLHVRDAARAVALVLTANERRPGVRVYNCGSGDQNFRLREIADLVVNAVPEAHTTVQGAVADTRNYRVNFDAVRRELSFHRAFGVRESIDEVVAALRSGQFDDIDAAQYSNYLIARSAARLAV